MVHITFINLQMDPSSKVEPTEENGGHVFLVIHDAQIGIHP